MPNTNQPNQAQSKQLQIKISDEMLKGVYANAMQVAHSQEEFMLDFLNLSPHLGTGVVTARVIMSPGHLKRVIAALSENLKRYEDRFGKIEQAQSPEEIGFKG